jgi:hypothetical protein
MDGTRKLRVQPFGKVVFSLEANVTKRLIEMERFFGLVRPIQRNLHREGEPHHEITLSNT